MTFLEVADEQRWVRLEPGAKQERLRERSKALFGNRDRLEVAALIASATDKAVNASDLSVESGIVVTRVRAQLLALAEAGLLVQASLGDRKIWYQRQDSPFWQLCALLYADWSR